jgi:hypothetical protein
VVGILGRALMPARTIAVFLVLGLILSLIASAANADSTEWVTLGNGKKNTTAFVSHERDPASLV